MLLTVFNSWVFSETRRLIQVFPEPVQRLWNFWELRVLVLVSLTLQLCLLHLGSRRRYSVKIWLRIFLWFSYLIADSVATVALGAISNNLRNSCDGNDSQLQNELTAFWAPFLLLHLGGQDTITAYAVQDNELWLRHLLGLVVQTMVALYIFLLSWKANWLSFLTIPMLLAGFIKYTERILVMRSANCGLNTPSTPSCESIEEQAFWYFKMFRYLFLNKKISNFNRNLTDDQVLTTFDSQTTWKVIEVELGYAYDIYYTKAPLFFTAWGFIFRFFSFTSILFVFVVFLLNKKHNHPQIDLIITYLLLVGAILMEIYAVCLLCASDWPWSATDVVTYFFPTLFAPIRNCFAKLTSKQRWSNSMAQLNLLSLCIKDNSERAGHKTPKLTANLRELLFNQMLPKLIGELKVTHKQVSADLKDLVYNMFLEKLSSSGNGFSEEYDKYIADRNGTINMEYYQSIIIWHIVTDLCFDTDSGVNEPKNDLLRKVSKDVSDYVMYILVMCPFLLSTGDAKFSFKITGAMVTEFFQKKKFARMPKADACAMLISEYDAFFGPKYEALDVRKNNDSLEDCLLHFAVLIEKKLTKMERKWEILSKYWVENLAYVATLCQGNHHAQLLRKGGEFLTHVWLLIEHLNLKESFQK